MSDIEPGVSSASAVRAEMYLAAHASDILRMDDFG